MVIKGRLLMTKIFAHRGSAGTHPENTMSAFLEAERVGADGIELDVQYTQDNELAVIHDHLVDRTTNSEGAVRSFTLKELQALDAGSWFSEAFKDERISSLDEVLDWVKQTSLILNVELKYAALDYEDFEEEVVKAIENHDLVNQVVISSFNHPALKKVNTLNSNIECGILYGARLYEPWHYAKTLGARSLHPHKNVSDPGMIRQAITNDITVRPYTINDKVELGQFIENGCSAIITDYPERALKVLEQRLKR